MWNCISHWKSLVGKNFSRKPKQSVANLTSMSCLRFICFFCIFNEIDIKNIIFQRHMAFEMLTCYQKETNETIPKNCSALSNSTMFKLCIAEFDDIVYNDFLLLYGQVFMICEFFNGSRPVVTFDKIMEVTGNASHFWFFCNSCYIIELEGEFWKSLGESRSHPIILCHYMQFFPFTKVRHQLFIHYFYS